MRQSLFIWNKDLVAVPDFRYNILLVRKKLPLWGDQRLQESKTMKLTFIGADHEVTGSEHLLETKDLKILID